MRVEDVIVEAHRDFQGLGIVLILKLGDEHFIVFILNCTYTLYTLFGMFNRFQNRKK